MARLELALGEAVVVTFAETDGEITIAHTNSYMSCIGCSDKMKEMIDPIDGIVVHADLPDSSGREGIIYLEEANTPKDSFENLNSDVCMPIEVSTKPVAKPSIQRTLRPLIDIMAHHVDDDATGMKLDFKSLEMIYDLLQELKKQKLGDITARLDHAQRMLDRIFMHGILSPV